MEHVNNLKLMQVLQWKNEYMKEKTSLRRRRLVGPTPTPALQDPVEH